MRRIVGGLMDIEHLFPGGHTLRAGFRNAPLLTRPRFQRVFLTGSIRIMVAGTSRTIELMPSIRIVPAEFTYFG
jgi:hypothetical protein